MAVSEIVERFDRLLHNDPGRALIHLPLARKTLTARDLGRAARRQRATLAALGFDADHLIIYAAGNRPELFPLWLACRARGVTLMPVDSGTTTIELQALAARFGASAVLVRETADMGTLRAPLDDTIGAQPPDRDPAAFAPGIRLLTPPSPPSSPALYKGAAVLKLTSGSTGVPKATFTTEAQLLRDSEHIASAIGIRPSDCQMAAIPLSHAYGIGNVVIPLLVQGTAAVLRDAFVPQQFVSDATIYGARIFPGVPFMFDHFNAHLPPGAWPARLSLLVSAGARLETATRRAFQSSFGLRIHSFYGTTETGGISYDDSGEVDAGGSVGRPLPGVSVTLRAEAGLPADRGRVHVVGSALSTGYVGGEPFESGDAGEGFLTGDVGHFNSRGRLVLTGRVSSFINVAGKKVQPDEVEQVLREMPGITDARVVGIPDPARGQQIVACIVVPGGGATAIAVRQFCATRLSAHKIPRTVLVLDEIPLTERGKTDRRRLDAQIAARLGGRPGTSVL